MNIYEREILSCFGKNIELSQRELAEMTGFSLGMVNKSIKTLRELNYIENECLVISKCGINYLKHNRTNNAIILAAGFGMRMVPINLEMPKGLLEIKKETLIERIITQLQNAGIKDITVVVGFMKESYEFLIDKYDVKLVVNTKYASRNNLHSLALACDEIDGTYIVPCDMYFENNPFRDFEIYSWYMVADTKDYDSYVQINRRYELTRISHNGNHMVGVAYISREDSDAFRTIIKEKDSNKAFEDAFWEDALFEKGQMLLKARMVKANQVTEINTYEQLRDLDKNSFNLESEEIAVAAKSLNVDSSEIVNIKVLKKGMTNRSFEFECDGRRFIMRIPGEGTNKLINRREEFDVYQVIKSLNLCDELVYINPQNGYKITRFIENGRNCNPQDDSDLKKCMRFLREFHAKKLIVDHEFDLKDKIEFYERLWNGKESCYRDYKETKKNVLKAIEFVEENVEVKCLCHIDSICDNFMIFTDENNKEQIRLIDWEYSAMQDPNLDIAMFAIYAMYDRTQVDKLIDYYYDEGCSSKTRHMIYAYISIAGLLWSNWCEYKRNLGVEFGEYSLRQYRYAKEYYRILESEGWD